MKQTIVAFLFAAASAVPGVFCFIALFVLGVFSNQVEILMYRGLLLAAVAALVHMAILSLALGKRPGAAYLSVSAVALALAANVTFLVVLPVTIDRSVSVYLLGQLARHEGGMTKDELDERLVHQYIDEYGAVARRMREQIISGNVARLGERYVLTAQGRQFIALSRFITDTFHIDAKYVQPTEAASSTSR